MVAFVQEHEAIKTQGGGDDEGDISIRFFHVDIALTYYIALSVATRNASISLFHVL